VIQKQRILIARAVYKNPEFIFFDEATNALDANNEKIIMDNLEAFFKGKTVIVVAHRLSTVKNADKIVVIEKGKIKGDWSYSKTRGREILLASITPIDNKFSVFNSSIRLSAIHGLLKVANNQLLISDLKGKWGLDEVALDGSIRLTEIPEVNLDITFRNGQFFYKDRLDALLSGNLNLLGNAKP